MGVVEWCLENNWRAAISGLIIGFLLVEIFLWMLG